MGVTTFDDPERLGLSVTLGGGEVRLLELAAAYGALANGGYALQPTAILHVEDEAGHVLLAPRQPASGTGRVRVLDERVAYLITDVLSDAAARIPAFSSAFSAALPCRRLSMLFFTAISSPRPMKAPGGRMASRKPP